MSKKLQCKECGRAEYGEDLYNYDGKILCRYCIVARVYEGLTSCVYIGTCNDKTFPNKADQIDQLKQQLAEKDKEINSLIVDYEKRISQEQELMSNLEKQLAEKEEELLKQKEKSARTEQIYNEIIVDKDKEIEKLNKTLEMCKHIERYDIGEMFLENAKLIIEKMQFAIQELEKVKTLIQNAINFEKPNFVGVYDAINKQIKELKGEKDVKD